jgi:hypothetical protein
MAAWTSDELTTIGNANLMQVASLRPDGSLRRPVTVWVVRLGDDIYTRSVNGRDAAWFRGTRARHEGRISPSGVEKDVSFIDVDGDVNDHIDDAYRHKYGNASSDQTAAALTPMAPSRKGLR